MTVVNVANRDFAIGLPWRTFMKRSEAAGHLKGAKWRFVLETLDGEYAAAPAEVSEQRQLSTRVLCGAAAVAARERNAVVHHAFDDGRVWLCAVKDGCPLPDYDKLYASAEDARPQFTEAINFVEGGHIWGNGRDARGPLEELLGSLTEKELAKLRMQRKAPIAAIVSGVALSATLVGGVTAWVWFEHKREAAEAIARATSMATQQTEAQRKAEEERIRVEQRVAIESQKAALRQLPEARAQLESWVAVAREVPLSQGGYQLVAISCDMRACTAEWLLPPRMLPAEWDDPAAGKAPAIGSAIPDRITTELPSPAAAPRLQRQDGSQAELQRRGRALSGVASLHAIVNPMQPIYAQLPGAAGSKDAPKIEIATRGTASVRGRIQEVREFLDGLDGHLQLLKLTFPVKSDDRGRIQLEGTYVAVSPR